MWFGALTIGYIWASGYPPSPQPHTYLPYAYIFFFLFSFSFLAFFALMFRNIVKIFNRNNKYKGLIGDSHHYSKRKKSNLKNGDFPHFTILIKRLSAPFSSWASPWQ